MQQAMTHQVARVVRTAVVRTVVGGAAALCLTAGAADGVGAAPKQGGAVYVVSQDLCYDTFATTDLPNEGSFQLLEPDPDERCGAGSSMTLYGPGDPGYLGGRWVTPDGRTFSCPLMGPGYSPAS
jgi:hypothetical protein